jgi:hypothetical protein
MQPRLKTSKKWSPLPKELLTQIQSVFNQGFREHTKGGKVEASGRIYPEEILIRVGYRAPQTLKQNNWEISIGYRKDKDNVLKLLHLGVDVIGALFEQTFTAEHDHDFPRIWEQVDFEGRPVFIQYTTDNSELEAQADALLGAGGADDDDVAQGDWDADLSLEEIKATLGLDDENLEEEAEAAAKPTAKKKKSTQH